MNLRLGRSEWVALAFAVLVALGFLWHQLLFPSSRFDAGQYARMGREIAAAPPFQRFGASDLRTYGYYFFLSVAYRAAAAAGLPSRLAPFAAQFLLYLGACLFFRMALARISPFAARIAFVGMLVNYYVLMYTTETLTESVSLSLLVITGGCWLLGYSERRLWPFVVGSLAASSGMMVRPANFFVVAAWVLGVVVIAVRRPPAAARALVTGACIVAALALPTLPQLVYNVRHFGKWTPLIAQELDRKQQIWGIQDIKYATAMPPVPDPQIHYINPFSSGTVVEQEAPMWWYVENPGRGALTLAIHTFNLTDQDLLFTYSRDLNPWYRLPLGVVNHAAVALGVIGLWLGARRLRAPHDRDGYVMLLVVIGANVAMYAWTSVEMRFGSTLLLILFPLAVYAMTWLTRQNRRRTAAAGLCVAGYVLLALLLSNWVRAQAPMIRQACTPRAEMLLARCHQASHPIHLFQATESARARSAAEPHLHTFPARSPQAAPRPASSTPAG